ncbi:helix-turn-helix domain-containing protein [Breznakiellaceae bacterium SP9]
MLEVRIYPSSEQQKFLNKTLGSCRFQQGSGL